MDDILQKMKDAEAEANRLVSNTEGEAKNKVEQARYESEKKVEVSKRLKSEECEKIKRDSLETFLKERDEQIEKKVNDFINTLGNINDKKEIALKFLLDKISSANGK